MNNLMTINQSFIGDTFKDKFFEFLDVASKDTIRTYKNGISNFLQYIVKYNILNPNRNTIINWKTELKANNFSSSTINTYLVAVKSFFNFLDMYGMYPNIAKFIKGYNISVLPKKNVLTQKQIIKIYNNLTDKREKALFGLLITTGLRGVEVANAKIENIRQVNGENCLFIQCKGHTEADEYVKLADNVLKDILDYIGNRKEGNIFISTSNHNKYKGITVLTVRRIIKAIFERFGIDDETISLHSTRRSFACIAYNNNQSIYDIQQVLHHKNIATTTRYLKQADRNNNHSEKIIANLLVS